MRPLVFSGFLALGAMAMAATAIASRLEAPPDVLSVVNVTTDSSPGWIPTLDQRQQVIDAAQSYLDALDNGRYAEAYAMQVEGNRQLQTQDKFTEDAKEFNATAGAVKFWRVLKVTWTKDPAQAPFPGIYAAIDLVAQYTNVDRDCGYIVMYQQTAGGAFLLMRRENAFMSNDAARQIEERSSKAEVARVWAQVSRYCPNYVPPPALR